ncbi:hypothetical protein VIBNISOn1_1840040 [Vibrio nigripulchritudo SOn1]|uniref:Uncharacterized protein n=1 Tax=Vibrio nigripulchritudo SOn1 TaxID=1238450 RepID=A0AAV2VQ32_9VIBR|nr:hypothetical protein [Vibrio nigripulchritudo]CCO46657.1 hypothetical protein VIBNISOn1_1840040 [Vibrio nigripulchritudo SOn1]
MLRELDQKAVLKLLKMNVSIVLPEQGLIEPYEHMFSLNGENITLTGNSLNGVILVSGFHITDFPLTETGLAEAIENIGNLLAEFNQSIN